VLKPSPIKVEAQSIHHWLKKDTACDAVDEADVIDVAILKGMK
jgi:hypothetical protein